MNTALQFRSGLAGEGAIFAQQANFLPVGRAWRGLNGVIPALKTPSFAGFLPFLKNNQKNLTVAQPLLKEACDEMR